MAYLGNQPVVGDSANTFKLLDNIASFTLTFDATDTGVVSIANDTLSFTNHRFITGQRVTYTNGGGTAIGGLSSGTAYFIIKVDQNTIKLATNASNAASSTAINLTSGAAGTSHTLNVAFDGVNTKFKATHTDGTKSNVSRAAQISLSINGVIQQPSEGSSPTVGYSVEPDSTIVFSSAPQNGDKVFGSFIGEAAASFDITDNTINNFTGDGSTTSFNLSKEIPSSQDVLITLDGVTQHPTDASTTRAYSVTGQTLTFTSAPADGVAIQARLIGFAAATSSSVTGFYGRTGNVALINTDDISVQNISGVGATFTGNVNIGGVLTYEDVTNVDSVGLITARAGVVVGSGITLSKDGDVFFTGIATGNGSGLTALNASNISSGTVPTARLGSGTASSSTFLRGDSTFQTVNTDLVNDTSPQLGGDLDTNDFEINLGDSHAVNFGDSQDAEIKHTGANFVIRNTEGNIRVEPKNGELGIQLTPDGSTALYYDNTKKFETKNEGVIISNQGNNRVLDVKHTDGTSAYVAFLDQTTTDNSYVRIGAEGNDCKVFAGGSERLRIKSDGKIATGTAINTSNTYELSLTGADGTGGFYAHGRNHYLSNRSDAYASLTIKKSNADSDAIDYLQIRDSNNNLKSTITGSGNFKPIAGGGIDFSAAGNAGGMTSELLDDYEEGTYTPALIGGSSNPTVTYTNQTGRYTKVGNLVYVTFDINYTNKTTNGSGTLYISLPVTANSDSVYHLAILRGGRNTALPTSVTAYQSGHAIIPNTTRFEINTNDGSGNSGTISGADLATSGRVVGSCVYQA